LQKKTRQVRLAAVKESGQEDLLSEPISVNVSFAANPLSTKSPFITLAVINMYQFIDMESGVFI